MKSEPVSSLRDFDTGLPRDEWSFATSLVLEHDARFYEKESLIAVGISHTQEREMEDGTFPLPHAPRSPHIKVKRYNFLHYKSNIKLR
eukprot:3557712-Amphidinium_carterae.1